MDKNKQTNVTQVNIGIDPLRTPVLYADAVMLTSSENGIVLDVAQRIGSSSQSQVVARIGLSKEHADKLSKLLVQHVSLQKGSNVTGKIKLHN